MIISGNLKEDLAWKDMLASRQLTQELQAHYKNALCCLTALWGTLPGNYCQEVDTQDREIGLEG